MFFYLCNSGISLHRSYEISPGCRSWHLVAAMMYRYIPNPDMRRQCYVLFEFSVLVFPSLSSFIFLCSTSVKMTCLYIFHYISKCWWQLRRWSTSSNMDIQLKCIESFTKYSTPLPYSFDDYVLLYFWIIHIFIYFQFINNTQTFY